MEFQWIKSSVAKPGVTIQGNNITLNTAATKYVESYRHCLLGVDSKANCVAIKPISKHDVDKNLYEASSLNKISIGKGYARISNKVFVDEIGKLIGHPPMGDKFDAEYDEAENMLLIRLKEDLV